MPPSNEKRNFPIIGIGASAGGLEPLQRFLRALPPDFGAALVFIQHLSIRHKSLLQELLGAKLPRLVIREITNGLKVEAGRLYLAPPGREIRFHGGLFRVMTHAEGLLHLPIDEFLSSLAEEAGERAVAVILSGAGTDGARGCKAVRASGGTAYVQDPETAEFDSMPLAAMTAGQADAVLAPEDIARELMKIEKIGSAAAGSVETLTSREYDAFFRQLFEKTGARFDHYKKSVVSRRIRRRMFLHGIATAQDYLDLLSAKDSEAALLASDLMIGVTSFFRDRLAWKVLNHEVVRKLAAESSPVPVRVWTPASATGEEAYSITMMLSRELALAGRKREIYVFATDVNERALEKAREGRYPASISADVPTEYHQKYFLTSEDGQALVVDREIREHVVFAKHDLLTDPPFSRLDLVICRNFLIYLEPEAQEKCIALFHYALKDGGFLFLGNAETVGKKNAHFTNVGRKQCRVYRKVEQSPAPRLPLSVPYAAERATPPPEPPPAPAARQPAIGIIQEFLLEEFAPAAIAVDQNHDIIYHNGPTNRYLRQPRGTPTRNLLNLIPEAARNRVRGAIYRAGDDGKPVAVRVSMRDDNGRARPITLRISRIPGNIVVVLFREKIGPAKREDAVPLDATRIEESATRQLESELASTRQDLQSHIEQLRSLNEELHASNEELQASNEELETSREELQSLNEELVTVNSQLQAKIEEQEETNNDLNNFLTSTNIPTIFLDHRFRLRRFTPAMSRLVKLIPSDIGRPIIDMSQEGLGPGLIADAQSVLDALAPVRQELLIADAWFLRAVQPYRTGDNRIEGVVVTYSDITELKQAEERNRHLASFPQLNPNPVLEVAASGAIAFSNAATRGLLESLGMRPEDTDALLPPDMKEILRDLDGSIEKTLVREVALGDRVFGESIHIVPKFSAVRIYAFDITERKRAEESNGRLAALVASADDAIISKDLSGVIRTWNVGAENIFGYTAAEAIGRNISFLTPPGRKDEVPGIIARITEGKHIERYETERVRKDGTVIPVSLTYSPILDANGRVTGISKIAHDIAERREAEEAVRKSEEQFRRIVETASEGILVADADGTINFVNRKMADILGYSVEEVVGRVGLDFMPEDERAKVLGNRTKLRKGEQVQTEFCFRRKDGTLLWTIGNASPIFDEKGGHVGNLAMHTDITGRKEAEDALRRAKEDWERTFNTVPDLIALLDCRHTILRVNKAMADRLGLTPEQCVGARCYDVVHGNDGPPSGCPHALTCRDGREHVAEVHEQRLGGDFLVSTNPMFDGEGTVVGTVHVARDISDRKKAEEEIRRRVQELQAANDELARFNRAAVDRELRMVELKKEVNELLRRAGEPPRHRIDFETEDPRPASG